MANGDRWTDGAACPYCGATPPRFLRDGTRLRKPHGVEQCLVSPTLASVTRWKCPTCRRSFTEYPAMPAWTRGGLCGPLTVQRLDEARRGFSKRRAGKGARGRLAGSAARSAGAASYFSGALELGARVGGGGSPKGAE